MRHSSRYARDRIVVEQAQGSRGSDGFTKTGTATVFDSTGDAQALRAELAERAGFLDEGGLRFFATKGVRDVEPGMSATITREDGTTLEATVEAVRVDDSSLVLSRDG